MIIIIIIITNIITIIIIIIGLAASIEDIVNTSIQVENNIEIMKEILITTIRKNTNNKTSTEQQ